MKKTILKLRQLLCKHEWEFFDNDGDFPNFSFCEKCKKEVWHDKAYLNHMDRLLSKNKK